MVCSFVVQIRTTIPHRTHLFVWPELPWPPDAGQNLFLIDFAFFETMGGGPGPCATQLGAILSKFQYEISVLNLFGEQNDEAIIVHIWIMMHHDPS